MGSGIHLIVEFGPGKSGQFCDIVGEPRGGMRKENEPVNRQIEFPDTFKKFPVMFRAVRQTNPIE